MKPFDLSKFKKGVTKNIKGVSLGFHDPTTWLSTGCYALDYLVSGRFKNGGIPLEGKFTQFAGDSGSGKSYIASANLIKDAQRKGIFPVLIDTENALDESWMNALGVNTDEEAMQIVHGATVDDVTKLLLQTIDMYVEANEDTKYEDRPRMLLIIDSLGMLVTPTQVEQAESGDMRGDLGIKAKQITHMLRVVMARIGSQPIGIVATNHVMDSQDKYQPDKIPGGKMLEFASSIIVQMNKYLLKEDENGKKLEGGLVAGIQTTAVVRKSRYAKPFEKIKLQIPYDTGMNPYSGLFELLLLKDVIKKESGAYYTYTSPVTGEVFKKYRKDFRPDGILDQIMDEWDHWEKPSDDTVADLEEAEKV